MCMYINLIITVVKFYRIKDVKAQGLPVVDIDGGCLARKWQRPSQEGLNVEPLPIPQQPLTGWEVLEQDKISSIASKMPKISHGIMYQYLSSGAGHAGDRGSKTLYRGYNHWASGRIEKIEVKHSKSILLFCTLLNYSIYETRTL